MLQSIFRRAVGLAGLVTLLSASPAYAPPERRQAVDSTIAAPLYTPQRAREVLDEIIREAPYGVNMYCANKFPEERMPRFADSVNTANGEGDLVEQTSPTIHVLHNTQGYVNTDTTLLCGGVQREKRWRRNEEGKRVWYTVKVRYNGGKAHFYIRQNGELWPIVPLTWSANHAGVSMWNAVDHISRISYGTESEGIDTMTEEQYVVARFLDQKLRGLGVNTTLTHALVAYQRSEEFPRKRRRQLGATVGVLGRKPDGLRIDLWRITDDLVDEYAHPDVIAGRLSRDTALAVLHRTRNEEYIRISINQALLGSTVADIVTQIAPTKIPRPSAQVPAW